MMVILFVVQYLAAEGVTSVPGNTYTVPTTPDCLEMIQIWMSIGTTSVSIPTAGTREVRGVCLMH